MNGRTATAQNPYDPDKEYWKAAQWICGFTFARQVESLRAALRQD